MGGRSGEPLRQAGRLSRALAEEGEDDRREHHGPYRQGGENEGRCARDVPIVRWSGCIRSLRSRWRRLAALMFSG